MLNNRKFAAFFALACFWIWAAHTATGFLDNLITANSGRRSGIVGMLDSLTRTALVGPFGQTISAALLFVAGIATFFALYRSGKTHNRGDSNSAGQDTETDLVQRRSERLKHFATLENSLPAPMTARNTSASVVTNDASQSKPNETLKDMIADVCRVDSQPLRDYFFSRMDDDDNAPDIQSRRDAAFAAAFGDDPLPLTIDLYGRLLSRRGLPYAPPELRRLNAAFDDALRHGWKLSLAAHNHSLKFSDSDMSKALQTAGALISSGAHNITDKFDYYYWYIVRSAAEDNWPKHRDDLISMFDRCFAGRSNFHVNVAQLVENLLEETPLTREDVAKLAEFGDRSAELDSIRAAIAAELEAPLAQAMEATLDSGGGLLDAKQVPALGALRQLSPQERGKCFTQLLTTITGLHRYGLVSWGQLERTNGRYRIGGNYDPEYPIPAAMSVLFRDLTRQEIVLLDQDVAIAAFVEILPRLIYLYNDQKTLELVLDTVRQAPEGRTVAKLKALDASQSDYPFLEFRAEIEAALQGKPVEFTSKEKPTPRIADKTILFRQHFPPRQEALSYWGGIPLVPQGFKWPSFKTPDGNERALHFIMQLDCAEIADAGAIGLPRNGHLYFFVDLNWGEYWEHRVIHIEGDPAGFSPAVVPATLPRAYSEKSYWGWPQRDADWPRLLPRWSFDPVLISGLAQPARLDEDYEDEEEDRKFWPGNIDLAQALAEVEGAIIESRYFSNQYDSDGKLMRPFANFPHDWQAIRIVMGEIRCQESREHINRYISRSDMSEAEGEAYMTALRSAIDHWTVRANTADPQMPASAVDSDAVWKVISDFQYVTVFALSKMVNQSINYTLSENPDAARILPEEALALVRSSHALGSRNDRGLHINTPDHLLGPPSYVQGDADDQLTEGWSLLFEMSAYDQIGHFFAEGVYQFWIQPEDLAARRFDRVELKASAY